MADKYYSRTRKIKEKVGDYKLIYSDNKIKRYKNQYIDKKIELYDVNIDGKKRPFMAVTTQDKIADKEFKSKSERNKFFQEYVDKDLEDRNNTYAYEGK